MYYIRVWTDVKSQVLHRSKWSEANVGWSVIPWRVVGWVQY